MAALAAYNAGNADLVGTDQAMRQNGGNLTAGKRQGNRHRIDLKDTVSQQMPPCGQSVRSNLVQRQTAPTRRVNFVLIQSGDFPNRLWLVRKHGC